MSAVMTPTGSSSGRTAVRADHVRQHEEASAHEEDQRQQAAMQRAEEGANRMGNDQADEADDAAGGDAGRRQQRRTQVHQTPDPVDFGAQVVGRLITQSDQIQ